MNPERRGAQVEIAVHAFFSAAFHRIVAGEERIEGNHGIRKALVEKAQRT